MIFTTPVDIPAVTRLIDYSDHILCIGSCFAQNIAQRLSERFFRVSCNPWGTMYNPASIYQCLQTISSDGDLRFTADSHSAECESNVFDLRYSGGLWHSMSHHGDFSYADRQECERAVRESVENGRQAFAQATTVILTLGTAWVYTLDGRIVANCHKMPAKMFSRRMLSVDEAYRYLDDIIALCSNRHVIITVSPIRHLKDGLHGNQLSKATLLLAAERCMRAYADTETSCPNAAHKHSTMTTDEAEMTNHDAALKSCSPVVDYFPSYEILNDELRDYRFYADDMLHPSSVAVDYIGERFMSTYFSAPTRQESDRLWRYHRMLSHRPLHPDTTEAAAFAATLSHTYSTLAPHYPWLPEPDLTAMT